MKNLRKSAAVLIRFFMIALLISCGKSNVKAEKKSDVRIVSLGPSATEILFAIGAKDELVARTDLCDFPDEAKNVPSVGGFSGNTISLESILSFEPTLVYLFAGMHDFLIEPLEAADIQVYVSNANSIDAVKSEILDMGKITGHEKEARNVVKEMDRKLDEAKKITEKKSGGNGENAPKVYWEIWHEPMMSVGRDSFINDIILRAGGKNIFAGEESAYPMVSEEAVLYAEPDFIFYTGDGMGGGKPSENLSAPKGIFFMGDDDGFVRSSPRAADAVLKLSKIIWEEK